MTLTEVLYYTNGVSIGIQTAKENNSLGYQLPYKTIEIVDLKDYRIYALFCAYQLMFIPSIVLGYVGFDYMFVNLSIQVIAQFAILSCKVKTILNNSKNCHEAKENNSLGYQLPYKTIEIVDLKDYRIYALFCAYQLMFIPSIVLGYVGFDYMFVNLSIQVIAQFAILSCKVKTILNNSKNCHEGMKELVLRHYRLIRFSKLRWDICRYCEHLCEKKKTGMDYVVTNSYIYFLNHLPLLEDKRFSKLRWDICRYCEHLCEKKKTGMDYVVTNSYIYFLNHLPLLEDKRRSIKIVKTVIFFMKKINIEYESTLSDTPKFSFFKRYEELFSILQELGIANVRRSFNWSSNFLKCMGIWPLRNYLPLFLFFFTYLFIHCSLTLAHLLLAPKTAENILSNLSENIELTMTLTKVAITRVKREALRKLFTEIKQFSLTEKYETKQEKLTFLNYTKLPLYFLVIIAFSMGLAEVLYYVSRVIDGFQTGN
ncbi:hypothetical protein HZH68_017148 [Vespula germanica]|uniref:Odorant receptor n=1 Tax=Vespula germanica TaxID=30212 RepID=A0A834IYJ1_VESGE|nr:hypothetical protein HZH68_017148 [Vespula germanica]